MSLNLPSSSRQSSHPDHVVSFVTWIDVRVFNHLHVQDLVAARIYALQTSCSVVCPNLNTLLLLPRQRDQLTVISFLFVKVRHITGSASAHGSILSNSQARLDVRSPPGLMVTDTGALIKHICFFCFSNSVPPFCIVQLPNASNFGQLIVPPNS